ncbi:MAG: hypothetical protein HOO06_16465 [Bdellovibrionaceae bacterium]|jgi:hypothetical protein|nr:hypothetical protein [Pseudobdellovibrionaceae bacterium]
MKKIILPLILATSMTAIGADSEYEHSNSGNSHRKSGVIVDGVVEGSGALWKGLKVVGRGAVVVSKFIVIDVPIQMFKGFNVTDDVVGRSVTLESVDSDYGVTRKLKYTTEGTMQEADRDGNIGYFKVRVEAVDGGDISFKEVSASFMRVFGKFQDKDETGWTWKYLTIGVTDFENLIADRDSQNYGTIFDADYSENLIELENGSRLIFKATLAAGGTKSSLEGNDESTELLQYGMSIGYATPNVFSGYDTVVELVHFTQEEGDVDHAKNSVSMSVLDTKNKQGQGFSSNFEFGNVDADGPGSGEVNIGDFGKLSINFGF